MSLVSLYYLLFLCIVLLVYYITPKKFRWIVLLVSSYFFYCINDLRAVIFLIITTVTVYFATIWIKNINCKQKMIFKSQTEEWLAENKKIYQKKFQKQKKAILIITLLINFSMLFFLKYFAYLADAFANLIHVQPLNLSILLPLGISFYMFQTVGYLIDVYWGKVEPEKNILKLAVFSSFFPQMIQGPIGRYDKLAPQLLEGNEFKKDNLKSGVLLILWGFFKKLVIADRAALLYSAIMENFARFQGVEIFVGMLCFVLKLYCDFSGGIDIARGSAECLGINMAENFKRPFFAKSVTEYWRRWHITLGAWMKDYVLYPLTMSKGYNKFIKFCKKKVKGVGGKVIPSAVAMFFVFLLVGIWHGPNLTYILFGVYNGIIILIETIINETRKIKKIKPKECSVHKKRFISSLQYTSTFMLVYFGKYLSAAPNVATAFNWFIATFKNNSFLTLFSNFIDRTSFTVTNLVILIVSVIFLIVIEIRQERGHEIRKSILSKKEYVQWIIFYLSIMAIILLAMYSNFGGGFAYEKF